MFPLSDGLLSLSAVSQIEVAKKAQHDAWGRVSARVVTPSLGFGRLLYDVQVRGQSQNYRGGSTVTLGGDSRLRGYATNLYRGDDRILSNLEYRTRPLQIESIQFGLALFYDVGWAGFRYENLDLAQGAGIGLRALAPQIDRLVLRADWGFPLSVQNIAMPSDMGEQFVVRRRKIWPGVPFITFDQAF